MQCGTKDFSRYGGEEREKKKREIESEREGES
jgi:hypothetical protein